MPLDETQIKKFKQGIIQQLGSAKKQKLFWIKKVITLEGSLATCDHILKSPNDEKKDKSQKEDQK